jgi:putative transposase
MGSELGQGQAHQDVAGVEGVAVDTPPREGAPPAGAPAAGGDLPPGTRANSANKGRNDEDLATAFRQRLINIRVLGWPSRAMLAVAVGLILLTALALATRLLPQPLLDVSSASNHVAQTYQIPLIVFVLGFLMLIFAWGALVTGSVSSSWPVTVVVLLFYRNRAIHPPVFSWGMNGPLPLPGCFLSGRLRAQGGAGAMLTLEYKVRGSPAQFAAVDEAIRTVQFIRNTCLRLWMDGRGVTANDLQAHCSVLAQRVPFVATLNSQARQQAADRAWAAISRVSAACRAKRPGRQGYPRFQRHCRSVEYKVTGWRLEPDGRHIAFTDGQDIGRVRLVGTCHIDTYPVEQIKRVRLLRRADGYDVQFCVQAERRIPHVPTGTQLGIDVGLAAFLTDSDGNAEPNPRYLRAAEPKLKRLHRRVARKTKGSKKRHKARKRLARA